MSRDKLKYQSTLQENWPPKWFFTYADLATLLMTFFVVLATMLALNIPIYMVADRKTQFLQRQKEIELMIQKLSEQEKIILRKLEALKKEYVEVIMDVDKLQELYKKVKTYIKEHNLEDILKVRKSLWRVEVIPTAPIFFGKGKSKLTPKARRILNKIGEFIKDIPSLVYIEGRTDDLPLRSRYFSSSWELASSRANTVASYLIRKFNISPKNVIIRGYGKYKPLVENKDERSRKLNRSVIFQIIPLPIFE